MADLSYQNTEKPSEDRARDPVTLLIDTEKRVNASIFAVTRDDASTVSAFTEMRGRCTEMDPTYVVKGPVDADNDEFAEDVKVKRKLILPYISLRRSQRRPNPTAQDTMRLT